MSNEKRRRLNCGVLGDLGPLKSQLMKLTTAFIICIRLAGLALAELTTEGKLLRDALL